MKNIVSPTASEPDSLGEKEAIHKTKEENYFPRGAINGTTFTRRRPTNLHRNRPRGHRSSLLSPQSVDNLDADAAQTPEFAMTQSMYEPTGKKEQIEKMNQQSRLMNLIASEKTALAAQKRKKNEMKQKANEQKKRNEERQKIVEERRLRMLAEEEERRQRLITKVGKTNNITNSCCGSMTHSISLKQKLNQESKFLANRPLASTGKVFGFGSSAPRYICDAIKPGKTNQNNSSWLDMTRLSLPLTRMCASQIMPKSTHADFRGRSNKISTSNISKSTINISEENKLRIKNKQATSSNVNMEAHITRRTPKNIKTLCSLPKTDIINKKPIEGTYRSRTASRDLNASSKHSTRSIVSERQLTSQSKSPGPKNHMTAEKGKRPQMCIDDNKVSATSERTRSVSRKQRGGDNGRPVTIQIEEKLENKLAKKSEVRFSTEETASDKKGKENSLQNSEKHMSSSKDITDEEYKQKISLQRRLAKEKRLLVEIEKENKKEKENQEILADPLTPVDTSITTESEISINILPKDEERNIVPIIQPIVENMKVEDHSDERCDASNSVPNIEVTSEKTELTASTDDLDRLERKKRLESIMSRIKKTPTGSSDNVNQHVITSSVLQHMMDKGHLSGMSKTAAVLMRNANRSSDLSSSTSDILGVPDKIRTSLSMEHLANGNENSVREEVSRGDCDGKEDSPKEKMPAFETKSNLMQNLSSHNDGSYLTQWKEKYSTSDSVDSENDNTEPI